MGKLRHTRYVDHVLYRLVSAELRKERRDRGIQQKQMARVMGISAASLNNVEMFNNRVSLLLFVRLCRAMDLRPGEVLDRVVGWIDDADLTPSEVIGTPLPSADVPRET